MATTTSLAPGLARKVKKILEIKTEAPELINSLNTLSDFYGDNTQAARRSLRSTIEKRGLAINDRFIAAAENVIKALDGVQGNLDGLSVSCLNVTRQLSSTQASTGTLLSETERLSKELEGVERRAALVHDFLEQYQLTPEEAACLQGEEVDAAFFAALARVRAIHENCRGLLRTHHQRAGLELMDMMATHQESAYERLCRWVQGECRSIGEYDAPEVDGLLQTAVGALRERPVLFKYCAEEVATARHNALFQRFITALTRGGPGGVPRPIEIHAHDPQRYINDMLAWVHQALASEREFVVALFGEDPGSKGPGHTGAFDDSFQEDGAGGLDTLTTSALLDRVFESICRPLRVRIEQVLLSGPPLLLCFQLGQLHAFYYSLVLRALGPSAQLSSTLRSCRDMAQRVFLEQLKGRGDKLLRHPPVPPPDLSPPPQVAETVHQLVEIVTAYESALEASPAPPAPAPPSHGPQSALSSAHASAADAAFAATDELNPVLAAVLDPLVSMCERSAEALTPDAPSRVDETVKLDPAAHRIYLINCLSAVVHALSQRATASQRSRQLGDLIEGHLTALVAGQVSQLLGRCGLAEIVDRLRLYQGPEGETQGMPASDPALALPRIADAMRGFFVLVSSPDALPEFGAIQVPRTRAHAVARVARSLVECYELVYSAVDDPRSGYLEQGGGASAIKHTPAQVRTILGVL